MTTHRIPSAAEYPLLELSNPSGLKVQLTSDGRLIAFRCGDILLNQVLPTPCEHAMTRLYLRDRADFSKFVPLIGPIASVTSAFEGGIEKTFRGAGNRSASWVIAAVPFEITLELQIHPTLPAWRWNVAIRNTGDEEKTVDLLYGQDLGLAHEGFVRMNEAYCSQYLDHRMERDPAFGPVILSRQNQAADGKFPWIAQGMTGGAHGWSTDGYQFFGTDHRLTGRAAALGMDPLPCSNLQYEFAYPALQSPPLSLAPKAEANVGFFALFSPDHPAASSESDLAEVRSVVENWPEECSASEAVGQPQAQTLWESPWLHGDSLSEAEWVERFPGERRHEELDDAGTLLSFFIGDGLHVVSRRKEEQVEQPHSHILRSGRSLWLDDDILGTTVGMAGVFNAQVFLGNTNLARFLSVIRNPLGVMRASGQRIFVGDADGWQQLGVPSAFEMGTRHTRWLYQTGDDLLEVTTRAVDDDSRIDLEIRVITGPPRQFLISHLLLMGDNEMAGPFQMTLDEAQGRIECRPEADSLLGQKWPGIQFLLEADPASLESIRGDERLFVDGISRGAPFAVIETKETAAFHLRLRGENPAAALSTNQDSGLPSLPRLKHSEPSVGRASDLLPWFAHDAWIHYTTPHGLEQYGGAAWGTRDVCQGPVEWLLATRQYEPVRRILLKVFEQQYEQSGSWPQWFMFEPFRFIQGVHSHGDIVFWPLKALCDYIEATNDPSILQAEVPYTVAQSLASTSSRESLTAHVEKILSQYEERCLPGTALVNYGDGDWDDTLQPADPALRSGMVSAWTVGLAYDAFRRYRAICERAGRVETAARLDRTLERIREDFHRHLMPDGVIAGFGVSEAGGLRPLIHPSDTATGIRYRLLPMTRGVLSELLTPDEARAHFEIIREHLLFPDGVRLMSDPIPYRGGVEHRFKRAETAANFGREIGLMYSHAHLRYAEALAKLGHGEELWRALQSVNPIGLKEAVPNAAIRQANVYFTSSDGAFPDRYEAGRRFGELRDGRVPVKGGWRLYSSGPGLFIHKVLTCLLGLRESFGDVVIDPVLPPSLDGLAVEWEWNGRPLEIAYRVQGRGFAPSRVTLNGIDLPTDRRDANPYRDGGVRIPRSFFESHLLEGANRMEIVL